MKKERGASAAMLKAEKHFALNPEISAPELAKRFGLHPITIYRAPWWKARHSAQKQSVQ